MAVVLEVLNVGLIFMRAVMSHGSSVLAAVILVGWLGSAATAGDAPSPVAPAPRPTSLADVKKCATAECHAGVRSDPFVHAPVRLNRCPQCHEVADEAAHTFKVTAKAPELCQACHEAFPEPKFPHKVMQQRKKCLNCHKPHGADNKALLVEKDTTALCQTCHEFRATEGKHVAHAEAGGERGCSACHGPHGGAYPGMTREKTKELCAGCHSKSQTTPDGRTLPAVDGLVGESKSVHNPVLRGNCSSCHRVHGTSLGLLKSAYPDAPYAPYSAERYALCFDCHDEKLITDARTTTATEFRNGDWNLHTLHVHKPTKGRTCGLCHSPHGAEQAKLIRKSVLFGEWQLPITFTKTDTGGTCSVGCHIVKRYDRSAAVDYTAPSAPVATTTPSAPAPDTTPTPAP